MKVLARSINLAKSVSIAAYECYRQLSLCLSGGV
jgi:tRNA(Leu) C34 or U34 (ribose-2'-O)-methylase TrmL